MMTMVSNVFIFMPQIPRHICRYHLHHDQLDFKFFVNVIFYISIRITTATKATTTTATTTATATTETKTFTS